MITDTFIFMPRRAAVHVLATLGAVCLGVCALWGLVYLQTGNSSLVEVLSTRLAATDADTVSMLNMLATFPMLAAVLVAVRQLVGVRTFGVFSPIVLAFALHEMQPLTIGLFDFVVCVLVGVVFRIFFANRLQLPSVASAAVSLTVVVALVFVSFFMGYTQLLGLDTVFLPVIILGFLIERIADMSEQKGVRPTLTLFASTVVVAVVFSYVFALTAHADTLALALVSCASAVFVVLVSQYTGLRVSELVRFRGVAQ